MPIRACGPFGSFVVKIKTVRTFPVHIEGLESGGESPDHEDRVDEAVELERARFVVVELGHQNRHELRGKLVTQLLMRHKKWPGSGSRKILK